VAAKEAGLGEEYETAHLPEPVDAFDALMRSLTGVRAVLPAPTLELIARRAQGFDRALHILVDALTSPRPTRIWMMMPEGIEIR
jgi:hypothetical protein